MLASITRGGSRCFFLRCGGRRGRMLSTAALAGMRLAFAAPVTFAHRARCLQLFMMLPIDQDVVHNLQDLVGIFWARSVFALSLTALQKDCGGCSAVDVAKTSPGPVFHRPPSTNTSKRLL